MTFAELLVTLAAVWGLYRLLWPFQRRVERLLLGLLGRDNVIDAEIVHHRRTGKE